MIASFVHDGPETRVAAASARVKAPFGGAVSNSALQSLSGLSRASSSLLTQNRRENKTTYSRTRKPARVPISRRGGHMTGGERGSVARSPASCSGSQR
ncbi:hypothetical protein SKAU_G00048290 [Synaphobranchus kaupii]|uniref:Uncharacterized protein n=1 Tax=Synaphobranchus kaupii TaxID=118154 RepID=A0A9Q1J7C0_SYNKA|nr:hypothetical protein SKAU_G00048290 [Synaphobranchus kaupii]